MTAARALQIDDWVLHRPNVVRSVAARVPGVDPEEATSRALEKMVRIVSTGGTIEDPAPYWRRAAVNEAISMTREAGRARPVEDDTLAALTPPVAGAELDAERQADVSMLRSALSDLADDDRKILLDRHVRDMAVADIAGDLGVRPHAVTMRLRRAEERLAGAFAAAHAQEVNEPECRATRAAMHDYLKDRLLPRRRGRVEEHMDGCAECTRAFTDVREVSWMLRDLGQHLVAGAMATGALGAAVAGAAGAGAGAGAAGAAGAPKPSFGKKEAAIVAGILAALAIGGGAAALVANQPADPPAAESVVDPGAGGGAGGGGAGEGPGGADEGDTDDGVARGADDAAEGDAAEGEAAEGGAGGGAESEVGDGAEGGSGGSGGDGSGGSGSGGDDSNAVEDSARDIADSVSTWLDSLGTPGDTSGEGSDTSAGDGSSDGAAADRTTGDAESADGADGADGAEDNAGGSDNDGGTEDRSGSGNGNDADSSTDRNAGSDGTTSADGADPGVGAELTDWFTRLGIAGIPAFLLLVFLLWLWDRWSRADE
ncbi:zf-HC2 domain-containing protein [Promicromonospora sp. NPDC057488]|uniref:zf-HC2 domain-containing protein n=1 Tax=Promicromonospora sp. NPDC057488 TaxID=3346147 RepID=UPI00366A9607